MAKGNNKDSKPNITDGNFGSLLGEYRETAGYSLTQMAEALCLPEDTLKKLENEDFHSLPEPPYVRGYLRNYAKLADKDPSDIINIYESLRGADPSELDYHFKAKPTILSDSKRKISPVMGQVLLLSILLAVIVGISMIPAVNKWISDTWNSFSQQTGTQNSSYSQDLIGTMPIPVPFEDEKTAEQSTNKSSDNSNEKNTEKNSDNKSTASDTPAPETGTSTNNNQTSEKPADTTQQTQTTTPDTLAENTQTGSDIIHIKLIFNKEVWMKVKDGTNKTVFEGLNAAGGSKDLDLKKPLHFRVGNAQGLSLFVDDKAVDISSYIKGSVAKFTLE